MRHVTDVAVNRRWTWSLSFVGLILVSGVVVVQGLIAPWTDAPESVTMTLLIGGVSLGVIAFAGVFSSVERIGQPMSWLVRWFALAVVLFAITVGFYAYG